MASTADTLNPRRVLLVGASSSFGPELARLFLEDGALVLATTRSGGRQGLPEAAMVAPLDLTRSETLDELATKVVPRFGALDVAVFMAGLLPGKALDAYDDPLQQTVMDINFGGQAALLRRLLPCLRPGAQVWMVSSISGERGSFDPIYAASKAALIGFVKSLATWHAPGLRANALAPALIEGSPMFADMSPQRREHHRSTTPTGRLTTPQQVAAVLFNLCGPAWDNLNGQVIRINGGAHV
jgi:NAD(P)-dependent dehydrogenase (short-subunit alcohol dehydrogenase family)